MENQPDSAAAVPETKRKPSDAWPGLALAAVAAIFLLCIGLWRFPALRPALAAAGAGAAAFLGPLPGLLAPETRGKWLASIAIAALIAAGTWLATSYLDDNWHAAEERTAHVEAMLAAHDAAYEALLKEQSRPTQDAFLTSTGTLYRNLFTEKQYDLIRELSELMLDVRPDNGHARYYLGETYHLQNDRTQMRGTFQRYLADADAHPEAARGSAAACYAGASGYCAERLGWVNHVLAADYLDEAASRRDVAASAALHTALDYERADLAVRRNGFNAIGRTKSSCEVLQSIESSFKRLGEDTTEVARVRRNLGRWCVAGSLSAASR